ncbi:MAG: hypothetical protein KAR42_15375 [candidate division Zixibacteria bacterium]|nr:hypothetical protein [candidate division Zixibacteria bacterium]
MNGNMVTQNTTLRMKATKRAISLRRPVYGVGINDAWYMVVYEQNGVKIKCPYYAAWRYMLQRCYQEKYLDSRPTYRGCSVCDEWLIFSNFKLWMEKQDFLGKELDKDILIPGNKIYSPDACAFVNRHVNALLNDHSSARGKYPTGVHLEKARGKFRAKCSVEGRQVHIGYFDSPKIASGAYSKFKAKEVRRVAKSQEKHIKNGLLRHAAIIEKSVMK